MARSRHPGAVRRYREEGGERALGTTALFPRASRHTQHGVVSEKLSLPSWEHHPLASLPTTSSETEQQGSSRESGDRCACACYTFSMARKGLWKEPSHPVTLHSGTGCPGLNPPRPMQAGANSSHTAQGREKRPGSQVSPSVMWE